MRGVTCLKLKESGLNGEEAHRTSAGSNGRDSTETTGLKDEATLTRRGEDGTLDTSDHRADLSGVESNENVGRRGGTLGGTGADVGAGAETGAAGVGVAG